MVKIVSSCFTPRNLAAVSDYGQCLVVVWRTVRTSPRRLDEKGFRKLAWRLTWDLAYGRAVIDFFGTDVKLIKTSASLLQE